MDKQYRQEDIQELMSKLLEDVRNISEELSEYINCPRWNRPTIFFDDDDEYTIIYSKPKAITPDLPIEEPVRGYSEDTCDVPVYEDPSTFEALNDHSEILSDPNDDGTLSDDDDFEDIEYVSLEEVNDVDQEEKEFDLEDILQIQDVILREKLLNINRLIANIESLNANSTPNCMLKSTSPFPIPDSNSFFEKSDTSLSYSDNSLPEFESFSDHTEETSSGSTTTHANNSLPEIPQDHEDPCLFSILQSSGLRSFAYFGILNPDHVQRIENKAKTVRGTRYCSCQVAGRGVSPRYEVLFQVAAGQSERDTWHLACVSMRLECVNPCQSWAIMRRLVEGKKTKIPSDLCIKSGFDELVETTWNEYQTLDTNAMRYLNKKLKHLKEQIRAWIQIKKDNDRSQKKNLKDELAAIDALLDKGEVHDANMVKDFRPITLIGSVYKIISKILANRFVGTLGNLVNEVQSAFVANRQILDGPFIINELVQWCKRKKKHSMIFKVDFEKAYDSVRWDYMNDVLCKFGFGKQWCRWIQGCLKSSRGSILINGSPTREFQFHKGLKQGDSLSPFLFILIMESLHISTQRVVDAGLFKGITLGPSLQISHLFYADDAVFMGQWSESNIDTLIRVLECFDRASGLRINMNKSKLSGIYMDSNMVDQAAAKIGCATIKTPFSYLGSTVGGNMSRIKSWEEIIKKVETRLSKWKLKTLSIGGRLTLLKSVLGSIPIYHMSLFKVPKKVLRSIHGIDGKLDSTAGHHQSSIWVDIVREVHALKRLGIDLADFIMRKVGDGSETSAPRGGEEQSQLNALLSDIEDVQLANLSDRWIWTLEGSGEFLVASIRRLIDKHLLPDVASKTRWLTEVPIKINIHAWKVKLDGLPTLLDISKRGISIESILCPFAS
ncbi:RNA-directed DNA polymerase, eukaryota [Tanacetum coccineum]